MKTGGHETLSTLSDRIVIAAAYEQTIITKV